MENNIKKIERLKAELAQLEIEQAKYESQSTTCKIAELLHSKLCKWNHTDGCGWHYEKDFNDSTHREYKRRAIAVMSFLEDKMPENEMHDFIEKFFDVLNKNYWS